MWKSAVKFLIVMLLKNRIQFIKNTFFNKLNNGQKLNRASNINFYGLHGTDPHDHHNQFDALKKNLALMAESRATFFKSNFNQEVQRVASSVMGFMFMLVAVVFAGLVGIMWIFALAWNSPNRELILGMTMLVPLLAAVIIFVTIRNTWKKESLMAQTIKQIENDWVVFRGGLDGTADTSDAANH